MALGQCRRFFAEHPSIEAVAAYDTAGSVQLLDPDASLGAIASRLAAGLYGAEVAMAGIEDDPQNFTRFLLLAREATGVEGATKTSVVFALRQRVRGPPRSARILRQPRCGPREDRVPTPRGRPWEYSFYLDVLGDPSGPAGEAMAELRSVALEWRVLGSYPEGLSGSGA